MHRKHMDAASARARREDDHVEILQMVVAAYDARHVIILLTGAVEWHNHRIRWRQKLSMLELTRASVAQRPVR